MGSRTLQDSNLIEILSPLLRTQAGRTEPTVFEAAAHSVSPQLNRMTAHLPELLINARLLHTENLPPALGRLTRFAGGLAPLPSDVLELLAWQYSVDFRELAKTDEQLTAMIVNSIRWHRMKGTPASMRLALALFGFEAEIEEHGFGDHWAVYQLKLKGIKSVEEARLAKRVAEEMQPVRCQLRRIYNDELDDRYIIWTTRPTWSKYFWSGESGIYDPETGIVISIGRRDGHQAESLDINAYAWTSSLRGWQIRYVRKWIWSHSHWSDMPFPSSSFVSGEIRSTEWKRDNPDWYFRRRAVCRSQLTWSGADLGAGQYSDINAAWCLPVFTLYDNPWHWGRSAYSEDPARQTLRLCELTLASGRSHGAAHLMPQSVRAAHALHAVWADFNPSDHWTGYWDNRRWDDGLACAHLSSELVPESGYIKHGTRHFWGWNDWSGQIAPPVPPVPPVPGHIIYTRRAAWSVTDWSGDITPPLPPGPVIPGSSIWSKRHTWSVNPWTHGAANTPQTAEKVHSCSTAPGSFTGGHLRGGSTQSTYRSLRRIYGWNWSLHKWSDVIPAADLSPICAACCAARRITRKHPAWQFRRRCLSASQMVWSEAVWSDDNACFGLPGEVKSMPWQWGSSVWADDPKRTIFLVNKRKERCRGTYLDCQFNPVLQCAGHTEDV